MGVAGRMKFIIIKRRALKEIASKYTIFKIHLNIQIVSNIDIPKPVLNEGNELKYDPKKILISDLEFENL